MIFILEIPHMMPVRVWYAKSEERVMSAIADGASRSGETIYAESTGQELLDTYGYENPSEMIAANTDNDVLLSLAKLIKKEGVDATYYTGYGVKGYTVDPIDPWQCHIDFLGHDLSNLRVYMSVEEASQALADEASFDFHQGTVAHRKLKEAVELFL